MFLEPEKAIEVAAGHGAALSGDAWLRATPASGLMRRGWVRLRYSASYYDDPVRPLIRFTTSDGQNFLQPMNGAVLGTGEWLGRVPDRTVAVSISPVRAAGAFDFRLETVERVSRLALIRRGLTYDREALSMAIGARIINARQERWDMLKFAASATPLERYDAWHRRLYRAIDINGIDRPRTDWAAAPVVRFFMPLQSATAAGLASTLRSLRAQVYPRWSLCGLTSAGAPPDVLAAFRSAMQADERVRELGSDANLADAAAGFGERDVVAIISPGDVIPDYALATVIERLARDPGLRIVYGDEDAVASDGTLHSPRFKPDWSPALFGGTAYPGRLTCIRYTDIAALGPRAAGSLVDDEEVLLRGVVSAAPAGAIGHIRRVLYRRSSEQGADISAAVHPPAGTPATEPEVSIVIPTRDRAKLLAQCLKSLQGMTGYPRYNIVIVDNGSTEADALALLRDLARQPNVHVVNSPGRFNFSALCNAGARATNSPVIVFLNNDTVIFQRDWLSALVKWAVQANVGIVGAKLLFPNDRIEHAGVVLGHGGIAGHLYHRLPASEPGYMGRLRIPHEVAAVTGACIAVERKKFEAVGGFDAENLPVDLNDIDLCLRISEKGWATIWTPECVLYHLQSATRGFQFKPTEVYRREREHFLKQWPHVVRDDPYFHPALSLYSHKPALA